MSLLGCIIALICNVAATCSVAKSQDNCSARTTFSSLRKLSSFFSSRKGVGRCYAGKNFLCSTFLTWKRQHFCVLVFSPSNTEIVASVIKGTQSKQLERGSFRDIAAMAAHLVSSLQLTDTITGLKYRQRAFNLCFETEVENRRLIHGRLECGKQENSCDRNSNLNSKCAGSKKSVRKRNVKVWSVRSRAAWQNNTV